MQHVLGKPLFKKQKYDLKDTVGLYRTIDLPLWQDAYSCLDSLGFLKGKFCTPLGVYAASLLQGLTTALGPLGCVHRCRFMWGMTPNVGGASCPMR